MTWCSLLGHYLLGHDLLTTPKRHGTRLVVRCTRKGCGYVRVDRPAWRGQRWQLWRFGKDSGFQLVSSTD